MVDFDGIGGDVFLGDHVYVRLGLLLLFGVALAADFLQCEFPDLLLEFASKVGRVFHRLDALTLLMNVSQWFNFFSRLWQKFALLK